MSRLTKEIKHRPSFEQPEKGARDVLLVKDVRHLKAFDITIRDNKDGRLVSRKHHPTWLLAEQRNFEDGETIIVPLKGSQDREFGLIKLTEEGKKKYL